MISLRKYTVGEADALVPFLQQSFARISTDIHQARSAELPDGAGAGESWAGSTNSPSAGTAAQFIQQVEDQIDEEIRFLERMGVIVRGVEPGEVQVLACRGSEFVFLCWSEGEDGFLHWCGLEDEISEVHPIEDPESFGPSWQS